MRTSIEFVQLVKLALLEKDHGVKVLALDVPELLQCYSTDTETMMRSERTAPASRRATDERRLPRERESWSDHTRDGLFGIVNPTVSIRAQKKHAPRGRI
jgi:hypothetical protein